jgi:hypothetical protein
VLHARPHPPEVDRVHPVEVFRRFVRRVARRDHDPGVVERHVQSAERRDRPLDGSGDLAFIALRLTLRALAVGPDVSADG